MSGAKRILPLLAVLCFALFLLYGVYFNAFGANTESMMAFFGITESRQGFVMTIQSLGGIVMTVLLGLFGERLHKLYGLLAGAVLVGVAGVTIGTMPLYGNDSYGLLLVFALIGGVGYITIDLLMNGVIADVFPEKKSTLLPIVHGFYGLGAILSHYACNMPDKCRLSGSVWTNKPINSTIFHVHIHAVECCKIIKFFH